MAETQSMEQLQLVIGHALVQTELMGKTCDTLEAETNQKVQSLAAYPAAMLDAALCPTKNDDILQLRAATR